MQWLAAFGSWKCFYLKLTSIFFVIIGSVPFHNKSIKCVIVVITHQPATSHQPVTYIHGAGLKAHQICMTRVLNSLNSERMNVELTWLEPSTLVQRLFVGCVCVLNVGCFIFHFRRVNFEKLKIVSFDGAISVCRMMNIVAKQCWGISRRLAKCSGV